MYFNLNSVQPAQLCLTVRGSLCIRFQCHYYYYYCTHIYVLTLHRDNVIPVGRNFTVLERKRNCATTIASAGHSLCKCNFFLNHRTEDKYRVQQPVCLHASVVGYNNNNEDFYSPQTSV